MNFANKLISSWALFLFSTGSIYAANLPENHAVNGGLTIVPIDIKEKPEVFYKNCRIAVTESPKPNQWLLVVGVPLDNKNPIQELEMIKPHRGSIPFHVSNKYYPTQSLTISNQRKVDPLKADRKRIEDEKKRMADIFAQYSGENPFKESFSAPAHGPISSLFGLKRVYNKKPRAPHTGLDVAAPENSPVKTISRGTVVDVHDYFFTGNTVIVDHGMGIFSLYAHLKDTHVEKGQKLKKGDLIGTVGMTGRVTGPHLHWSMIMNETFVDPLLFVSAQEIRTISEKPQKKDGQ